MTNSAELQGQIGSEERFTGDTTGPNKPGHPAKSPTTNGNGNGNYAPKNGRWPTVRAYTASSSGVMVTSR